MRITRQRIFSEKKEEKGSKILPNGMMAGGGILGSYGAYNAVRAHLDADKEQKTLDKNIEKEQEKLKLNNKIAEDRAVQERAEAIERSGKRLNENIFKSLGKKDPGQALDAKALVEKEMKKEAARRQIDLNDIAANYKNELGKYKKWFDEDVAYLEETSAKNMKAIESNKIKGLAGVGLGAAMIGTGYYLDKRSKNKNKK